jgi:hypothetical protein
MNTLFNNETVTLSCVNYNSLNMSNSAKWNQSIKIYGITKLRSDIIMLSDIRLSSRNLISASQDITKMFWHNPYEKYDFYFNSTLNKRGVGILIKNWDWGCGGSVGGMWWLSCWGCGGSVV